MMRFVLAFAAVSNKTYSLLSSTNLIIDPWQRLFDVFAAPTNRSLILHDTNVPSLNSQRFYRLVTPQLP